MSQLNDKSLIIDETWSDLILNPLTYALSIKQPWLHCIIHHGKTIENRTWKPPQFIIGKHIALHASKKIDHSSLLAASNLAGHQLDPTQFLCGAIIATCKITKIITHSDDKWFFGPYGWQLEDIRPLKPIICAGALGFWKVNQQMKFEYLNIERTK